MMTRQSILLLLTLFLLGMTSSALNAELLEQTFSESLAGFKISTPNPNWYFAPRSVAPGPLRATLRFKFPVNQFYPNVTVRVRTLNNKKIKLEEWVKEDLSQLPPTVQVKENKKIQHGEQKGHELFLYDEKSKLNFKQWAFLAKGKSYLITCTAKAASWTRFADEFKMILNSFEIN